MEKLEFNTGQVFLFILFMAAFAGFGDYLLKLASLEARPFFNKWFVAGFIIYALNAFGWVLVFRYAKLATVGVIYSLATILILTALGAIAFKEKLSFYEILGLAFALSSIILLARFN